MFKIIRLKYILIYIFNLRPQDSEILFALLNSSSSWNNTNQLK